MQSTFSSLVSYRGGTASQAFSTRNNKNTPGYQNEFVAFDISVLS